MSSMDKLEDRITELLEDRQAMKLLIAEVTRDRDNQKAMTNIAYMAGYYQAECGLPEHTEPKEVAEFVLSKAYRAGVEDSAKESLKFAHLYEPFGHPAMGDDEIKMNAGFDITKSIRNIPSLTSTKLLEILKEKDGE